MVFKMIIGINPIIITKNTSNDFITDSDFLKELNEVCNNVKDAFDNGEYKSDYMTIRNFVKNILTNSVNNLIDKYSNDIMCIYLDRILVGKINLSNNTYILDDEFEKDWKQLEIDRDIVASFLTYYDNNIEPIGDHNEDDYYDDEEDEEDDDDEDDYYDDEEEDDEDDEYREEAEKIVTNILSKFFAKDPKEEYFILIKVCFARVGHSIFKSLIIPQNFK